MSTTGYLMLYQWDAYDANAANFTGFGSVEEIDAIWPVTTDLFPGNAPTCCLWMCADTNAPTTVTWKLYAGTVYQAPGTGQAPHVTDTLVASGTVAGNGVKTSAKTSFTKPTSDCYLKLTLTTSTSSNCYCYTLVFR